VRLDAPWQGAGERGLTQLLTACNHVVRRHLAWWHSFQHASEILDSHRRKVVLAGHAVDPIGDDFRLVR
jgi:hypothetical protein